MRSLVVAGLIVVASMLSGCMLIPTGCAGVGYYAIHLTVRDALGNPQALGATATLSDGDYQEVDSASEAPLDIYGAPEGGGRRYDIRVSKPFYDDVWVRGVQTRGGGCVTGHEDYQITTDVAVTLPLSANAPPVRSVRLVPSHILLDRAPYATSASPTPYLDASPGVSRALTWRISGDTGSVTFDETSGRLVYRCLPKSGFLWLIATSVADPSRADSAAVSVQGHPAASGDPPCG